MEITAALAAGQLLTTALARLTRSQTSVAEPSAEEGSPAIGKTDGNSAALRNVLAGYDVTDMSPRHFSEMIQKLHQNGAVSDRQLHDLSMIRADLDAADLDPDEPLNLLEFYVDRLREVLGDLDDHVNSGDLGPVRITAASTLQRRLEWLEKFALIQATPQAAGWDRLA
ncbi:MAG: hypothetical protein ACYTG0_39300 [Planctomycetota bacterium]|jgi:hypothetical protein